MQNEKRVRERRDRIYNADGDVVDFAFNEAVAAVFPDMIRRSVPGYETILPMICVIAEKFAQPDSLCYDLGCSLGASTLALQRGAKALGCKIIAVDNSKAMIERCRETFRESPAESSVELICDDIQNIPIEKASVVVLNFTLQFIAPDQRKTLLQNIYQGMNPGGALILSEKIVFENDDAQKLQAQLHLSFKKANGYSELEIAGKRTALENVLVPETEAAHHERLLSCGFQQVETWFQCFNFLSILAVK